MSAAGRKALVTGSSGSLGALLAGELLGEGWEVCGMDLKQPESAPRGSWRFVECDVSNPASVQQALPAAAGPFDVVVNNAGLIYSAPALAYKDGELTVHDFEAWNQVLSATLSSAFVVSAHCARQMLAGGRKGVIVNISSICAEGNAGQAAYSAAKAGVNAMTKVLAKELGPLGVRVAAIAPGFLDTPSTRASLSAEALAKVRKRIPLQRLGDPRGLYHALKFVIENDYFHGKVLELDGGLTL